MIGKENLESQIGKLLADGKFETMQIDNETPHAINVTFLKFDEQWLRVVTTDGRTKIILAEPEETISAFDGSTFRYSQTSLDVFPGFTLGIGKRLKRFTELVSIATGESFGLKLYFEGGENMTIRNQFIRKQSQI